MMRMTMKTWSTAGLVLAALAGCDGAPPECDGADCIGPEPEVPGDVVRGTAAFALTPQSDPVDRLRANQALYRLAFDLLAQDSLGHGVNTAVSPLSIAMALGQVAQGARGETLAQVLEALDDNADLGDDDALDLARLGAVQHDILLALRDRQVAPSADSDGVTLRLVNQLFAQPDFPFEEEFLDAVSSNYDAGVALLDFAADPEAARQTINAFVEDVTADRIEDLLPQGSIDGSTRLVLTNALYLLGAWSTAFEPERTTTKKFFPAGHDGPGIDVPMMHGAFDAGVLTFSVNDGPDPEVETAIVELPLVGDALSVVFIPDDVAPADLQVLPTVGRFDRVPVDIQLPRFTLRQAIDLKDGLEALAGPNAVTDLFDAAVCDLSGISEVELVATGAFHQAFVAVDEKGIEAAAATAIVVGETSIPPPPRTFVFDRPFTFVMRDVELGTPLFVGRVGDPSVAAP